MSPPFVDGHQHVHIIPEVSQVFAPCLRSYEILHSRIPFEDLSECDWIQPPSRRQFYSDVCENSIVARSVFTKYGILFSPAFLGLSLMGTDMTINSLSAGFLKVLKSTLSDNDPVDCELMCHPGYVNPPFVGGCRGTRGPDEFSNSPDRFHELETLRSKSLEILMLKHGAHLKN